MKSSVMKKDDQMVYLWMKESIVVKRIGLQDGLQLCRYNNTWKGIPLLVSTKHFNSAFFQSIKHISQ